MPIDTTPNIAVPSISRSSPSATRSKNSGARHFCPQVAADVKIRLQPAGAGFGLEAQRMVRPARDPIVDIGAEVEHPAGRLFLDIKLDREERRILDLDAALLNGRDQEILFALALEHRGEQLDQRRPADRRLEIEPGAVGGDAHVEIAAKRRIPALDRRRPLGGGAPSAPVITSRPACPSFAMVCLERKAWT